jgi:uncharacterized protein (DUF427 family)
MARAEWNGILLADEPDERRLLRVDGNIYFPADSVNMSALSPSEHTTECFWKGTASYYTACGVRGEGQVLCNENCAWCYREPSAAAWDIGGAVSFWKGVTVTLAPRKARDRSPSPMPCV